MNIKIPVILVTAVSFYFSGVCFSNSQFLTVKMNVYNNYHHHIILIVTENPHHEHQCDDPEPNKCKKIRVAKHGNGNMTFQVEPLKNFYVYAWHANKNYYIYINNACGTKINGPLQFSSAKTSASYTIGISDIGIYCSGG